MFICETEDCSASRAEKLFCAHCAVRCGVCCVVVCEQCTFAQCRKCERSCCAACLDEERPDYCVECIIEEEETERFAKQPRAVIRVSRELFRTISAAAGAKKPVKLSASAPL